VGLKDMLSIVNALLGTREKIILSFIGGFLVGLIIFGWWLTPLGWKDAAPVDLHAGYREIYLNTVARAYQAGASVEDVQQMLGGKTWSGKKLTRDLSEAYEAAPDAQTKERLVNLSRAVGVELGVETGGGGGRSLTGILLVALIVLIGGGGAFVLLRMRQRGAAVPVTVGGDPAKVRASRSTWAEEEAPLAQFVTSYALGEDYFDQSFSIETGTGEFLGECGVGISEAIGVGDPKKVTAFEVWLFDKNDIRTVTKVLMSEHCFYDDALRSKLAPKGEAVLGGEGVVVDLGTQSLKIQAKVIEMEYGEGNLPPNSFVTRLTVELAAWQLEGAGPASGARQAMG
jgi:hypothetical protein